MMRSSTGPRSLVDLFWVTVGQEFHGALEVGEQHRDLLALAFQGTAGREIFSAR
jgi:hypothetical protein